MPRDGRAGITADLVRELLLDQFPGWADLPIRPVPADGNDNRTYRLGNDLSVRLPTAQGYVAGVAKEERWLPVLAAHLPLPIPKPVSTGAPACGYPYPWSIRRWIEGEPVSRTSLVEPSRLAADLGGFLRALRSVDATDGPLAGSHSFHRGCPLAAYDHEVREVLTGGQAVADAAAAMDVWDEALSSAWIGAPVWLHGDVAVNNLLVREGRLAAVIDFGTCGVGDPACDFVMAWTFFDEDERAAFRAAVEVDDATWSRARGWALWKALITDDVRTVEAVFDDDNRRGCH